MKDELFDVPETKPRWRQLKEEHGIMTWTDITLSSPDSRTWSAEHESSPIRCKGDTEREAVIDLIHKLKLPGWDSLSPR